MQEERRRQRSTGTSKELNEQAKKQQEQKTANRQTGNTEQHSTEHKTTQCNNTQQSSNTHASTKAKTAPHNLNSFAASLSKNKSLLHDQKAFPDSALDLFYLVSLLGQAIFSVGSLPPRIVSFCFGFFAIASSLHWTVLRFTARV